MGIYKGQTTEPIVAITLNTIRQSAAVRGMKISSTRRHGQPTVYHCRAAYWADRNLQVECGDTTPERNWMSLDDLKKWATEMWAM